MYKKIPGSLIFSASLGGQIRNDETGCEPIIVNNMMSIDIYNVKYVLPVTWLGLVAHYEINLPKELQKLLTTITFTPFNGKVISSRCAMMCVFPPSLKDPIARIIPCFSDYKITCDGILTEISTERKIYPQKASKNGYPYVFIYNPDKNTKMEIMVHRLVALAWCDNDDWLNKSVVNHKDSNKLNYHYSNLEWVTYSENQIHANDAGEVSTTIPCKVRDTHTGNTFEFNSLSQAYRFLGIVAVARSKVFEDCKLGWLLADRYELKRLDDSTEWYSTKPIGSIKSFYEVQVTYNGYVTVYTIAEFKQMFKIWNIGKAEKIVEAATTLYPNHHFVLIAKKPTEIGLQGYNLVTNEIIDEPSIRAFSRRTGIPPNVLGRIYRSRMQGRVGDLLIRPTTDSEWNMEFFNPPSTPKRILATDLKTNSSIVFNSLRECARFFNVDRQTIKLRIERDDAINNYCLKFTV